MHEPKISPVQITGRMAGAVLMMLCFSATPFAQELERGVSASILVSRFAAGESGPTVVNAPIHPETRYGDTFGTGVGLTAQYFRQIGTVFRWQAGFVYRSWPGRHFEGGEFQPGWEFGAAGKFDDLTLAGVVGGLSIIRQPGSKLRPFAAIDLAVVHMSELNVVTSGASEPYWESTTKDFLTLKCGFSYQASSRTSVLFHAGMSILGKPDNIDIMTSATAGTSLDAGIGVSYTF